MIEYDLDTEELYDELVVLRDRTTGEPYTINPGGHKVWLGEEG